MTEQTDEKKADGKTETQTSTEQNAPTASTRCQRCHQKAAPHVTTQEIGL